MLVYLAKRLVFLLPVLLGITVLVFIMRPLVPGDPVDLLTIGQDVSAESKEALRHELGLDQPLALQYKNFLLGLLHGNLGKSMRTRRAVAEDIVVRYPATFKLALMSLVIAVLVGISTGVVSAVKKDSIMDFATMLVSLLGVSMPAFWLGLLLMYTFGVRLGWLPVMGSQSLKHLILPSLTLGLIYAAIISRLTRSTLLEVLNTDYIRTARAKGLHERVVIYKHALRNALIPIVTIVGLQFGYLLGGAFVVEVVFAYHGMGELAIKAIQFRDFPVIQAITLLTAVTVVAINLFVDLSYTLLDPQVRYG